MTQFTNATFSVHGKHCNGCSQRDVWLEQANERIKELEGVYDTLMIVDNHPVVIALRAALESAESKVDKLETVLSGRTYFHDNEAVEALLEQKDAQLKILAQVVIDICSEEGHGTCLNVNDDECLIPCDACRSWQPCQREACVIARSIL